MVRDLLQLNSFEKRALLVLSALLLVCVVSYGALVRKTVANVVLRETIEAETVDLAAHVSVLELAYMEALQAVTLGRALELGFIEKKPKVFVSRDTHPLSVRYGNE